MELKAYFASENTDKVAQDTEVCYEWKADI